MVDHKRETVQLEKLEASSASFIVSRSLIPSHMPRRDIGEHSSVAVSRLSFAFLTVPFAVSRFNANGTSKDMRSVRLAKALDASRYMGWFASLGVSYTLIIRAVVFHFCTSPKAIHNVTYTCAPQARLMATTRRNNYDDNWEVDNMCGKYVDEIMRNDVGLQLSIDGISVEQFQNKENLAAEIQNPYAGLGVSNGDTIDTGNDVMSQQVFTDDYNARFTRTGDGRRLQC